MASLDWRMKQAGALTASPKAQIVFLTSYTLLAASRRSSSSAGLKCVIGISAETLDPFITTAQQYLETTMIAGAATEGFTGFREPHEVKVGGQESLI